MSRSRALRLVLVLMVVVAILGLAGGFWNGKTARQTEGVTSVRAAPAEGVSGGSEDGARVVSVAQDPLILSYPAKFVCQEAVQPGQFYYGTLPPTIEEKTGVLVHNPQSYPVTLYQKAVRASLWGSPDIAPGAWTAVTVQPGRSIRLDCDSIAKLLTGNPAATFIGTYGIGVEVEGFVVVGVGSQKVNGLDTLGALDVTAEYSRGSGVTTLNVSYQAWWWSWWWPLPWRLGYAYQRVLDISDSTRNFDCRSTLYTALDLDVDRDMVDPTQRTFTHAALNAGRAIDPTNVASLSPDTPPALVALIGRCDKIGTTNVSVDYVLVSNKSFTDPDPRIGGSPIAYPWIPGRWYDLNVVMPKNTAGDLDSYIRNWHAQRWIDAGASASTVEDAIVYLFPWWCGWGSWSSWWNGGCVSTGTGEGRSLDVEQVVPSRVFMSAWPPVAAAY